MGDEVKYYIYISDMKVDMLYPQIPRKLLERIAAELSINLNLFGSGFAATIKGNQTEQTRYSKLRLITKYIEQHLGVGTIDAPQTYFKGILSMKWGTLGTTAIFTGPTAQTDLILTGSEQHFLEGAQETAKNRPIGSSIRSMFDAIHHFGSEAVHVSLEASRDNPTIETDEWTRELSTLEGFYEMPYLNMWPMQRLEFLARILAQRWFTPSDSKNKKLLLVGTPIYVALAD